MANSSMIKRLKDKVQSFKAQTYALYLAYKHPGTSWYVKLLAACVVSYAFSPIDLIPDFIPVIGHLDDLIIVPLGIYLAIRMIPRPIWEECLEQAEKELNTDRPRNWVAAGFVVGIWVGFLILILAMIIQTLRSR